MNCENALERTCTVRFVDLDGKPLPVPERQFRLGDVHSLPQLPMPTVPKETDYEFVFRGWDSDADHFVPFWAVTREESERHWEYGCKSNNWLKMHGRPMRRRCVGVKCRRRYPYVDEAHLLFCNNESTHNFVEELYRHGRRYGG